eukprot:11156360-Lingulodinium_polyedra.AAC.1
MMGPKDVSIGQVIIVGASGSRFYTAKGAVGPMPRLVESLLFREGDAPFSYVDLTEGGVGPVRWASKLDEWCAAHQTLTVTDRVSERQIFPSKVTVV